MQKRDTVYHSVSEMDCVSERVERKEEGINYKP